MFQANRRELDLAMVREYYGHKDIPAHNDFLGLVGSYEINFASAIPETTLNYATMFKPFDNYIWALIAISLISVILTFLVIDKVSALWMRNSTKNSFFQSTKKHMLHQVVSEFNAILSFLVFFMSIGPIIDESLDNKFVHITTSAKARQVLLVKWIVLGFCLTACYKSVLLSEMVNIGYEKTIDSVEDALVSGKLFVVPENTDVPSKIRNGIGNVGKLANQMKLANMSFDSSKQFPQWVYDGSV